MASRDDADVPFQASAALAASLGAGVVPLPGSHVAPLLGRDAPAVATQAAAWLAAAVGGSSVPMRFGERHRD